MGYTTDFEGRFDLDKELAPEHADYLARFADTRRVKRDAGRAVKLPDRWREAAKLPIGDDGGYFVGDTDESSILDNNHEPRGQPGLWCQWVPTTDRKGIEWDGGEKFYAYTEWLIYIVEHFLKPWGYKLSGSVTWQGEEHGDRGTLVARANVISVRGRRG